MVYHREPVKKILSWTRCSTGLVPHAVMSNCALAIRWAVQQAYKDLQDRAPKHYWCLFHVLKAFKSQALIMLKDRSAEALKDFHQVIYSEAYPGSLMSLFLHKWFAVSADFGDYAANQWHSHIEHWYFFSKRYGSLIAFSCNHLETDPHNIC
jgi:hypothetical protein